MDKITIVLGLGVSGQAAAEFLLKQGICVLGLDSGDLERLQPLRALGVSLQHDRSNIDWSCVQQLVASPGVPRTHPVYVRAQELGVPIVGEAELALPHFDKPLVAVTGTNGKTTVTLLVEHVLRYAGIRAESLGNIGTPLCRHLIAPSDAQAFVIELSSYQLETMHTPVFDAAVLLNITPDHLDRYNSMEEYAETKLRLQYLMKNRAPFYVQTEAAEKFKEFLVTGNWQLLEMQPDVACLSSLQYSEGGKHERENVLAAWALCRAFEIPIATVCQALATFCKPAHRIEFVREVGGVRYFDDSKGTNIDAVVQAVRVMRGDVILIVGGVDKGGSYLSWREESSFARVKKMIAIGSAAPKIYQELCPYFNVELVDALPAAVQRAAAEAKKGDCVLLSPGCSSFDQFRDYAHRGEVFQQAVQNL